MRCSRSHRGESAPIRTDSDVTRFLTRARGRKGGRPTVMSSERLEAARGPGAYAKRVARRRAYGKSMGATRRLLRALGLSK